MLPSSVGEVHALVPVLTAVTPGATPVPAGFPWYTVQPGGSAAAGEDIAAPAPPVIPNAAARASTPADAARRRALMAPGGRGRRQASPWQKSYEMCRPGSPAHLAGKVKVWV